MERALTTSTTRRLWLAGPRLGLPAVVGWLVGADVHALFMLWGRREERDNLPKGGGELFSLVLPATPLCCAFCFGAAVMYAPMAHTPLTAGKDHGRDVEHGAGMWAPNNAVAAMEASVRTGFLRKVFGLVACQLALTAAVSAIFMYNHAIRHFVLHAPSLTMVSFFVSLGFLFGAHLNKDSHPTNLYMLFGFTLSIAWSVGVTCAMYASAGYGFLVLEAVGITASVTAGLSLYTLRSKQDFSYLGASLGSALWVLILGGLVASLTGAAAMHTALAVGGAMIFSLYIVYDVQEIAKRMSPDEYVSAAISLYLVRAFRLRPPCREALLLLLLLLLR